MRLFDEHIITKPVLLDGTWDYVTDEFEIGEKQQWYVSFPKEHKKITIPSVLNSRLGYMDYCSVVWYRKTFFMEGNVTLKFHSVTGLAKVYLDGKHLGDHYGDFAAFEFDTHLCSGIHEIVIMSDSRSTDDTIPLHGVDWHHYCGILRSVELIPHGDVGIKSVKAEYELSDDLKTAYVKIIVGLKNYTERSCTEKLSVSIDENIIYNDYVVCEDFIQFTVKATLDNVRLWDIYKPELYTVTVKTDTEDLIDKIGFRKICVKGKKILLNNKPVKLLGVNRHEEHPDWGFAMPPMLNMRDMDILKDLGANTVRGSHYPNTHFFVDLCDAEGILFWSEIPMWGYGKESLERELVCQRGLNMHSEMIEQYYNHPSIVIWGMHNEISTETPQGYEITQKFVNHVKKLDSTRLLTYATNRIMKDICLQLVDFISVNQYIGWYEGEISDWAEFLGRMKKHLEEVKADNMPVVMSEFGVGALFGNKTLDGLPWSENYQQELYRNTLELFLNDSDMAGVYLWQFCDVRSSTKWSLDRARGFNNKGLLNEYRHPKLSYYTVRDYFRKEW